MENVEPQSGIRIMSGGHSAASGSEGAAHVTPHLHGRISLVELLSTVLAYSAPVAVVSGFIPFVIVFNGVGAPSVFIVAMLLLLLFAVGFTAMTRHVVNPGAFYAYVTAGLGRVPGLGAAFLAIFGYLMLGFCTLPFIGVNFNALVTTFGGHEIPWYWYALLSWLICGVLSYMRIDLSAKVLTVAMALEVIVVVVFDVAVTSNGGPEGRSLQPLTWAAFNSGAVGIAVLFAVTCFLGFEATAIFRDEVKNPTKTVPRAAYLAVLLIGVFYAFAAWVIITAYGVHGAPAVANKDPSGMFATAMAKYVGTAGVDVVRVLLVTSIFASTLSGQNIVARYLFSLGADGVLPEILGKAHPKHGSPYVAAALVSIIWLVLGVVFAVLKSDAATLYGEVAGVGGFAILLLMLLTSAAVVVFFKKGVSGAEAENSWHTMIAPSLSTIGLAVVVYLAISNFDTMIGGSKPLAMGLQVLIWGVFVVGVLLALYYKARRQHVFSRIGGSQL